MFKLPILFSRTIISRSLTTHACNAFNFLIRKNIKWEVPKQSAKFNDTLCEHKDYAIKVGNFPSEPLYSLFKGGTKIHQFEKFPKNWVIKDRYKTTPKL